jgi:glycosyltransferase involved in cell wall biosynthesis
MLQHASDVRAADAVIIPAMSRPPIGLRVLHVVNGEHFSGAERVQSHLGRCLPQFGVQADFACVKPGRFLQRLREQGGEWGRGYDLAMRSRLDVRAAWGVRDLVRQQGYEVLHAHTPRTAMITSLASRLTGVPWVYHVHSPAARDSAQAMSNRVNSWIEKLSLRSCDQLITVSESLRRDCLAGGADERRVAVVHNGVPAICPPRQSTPVPGGRWVIGMVALMRPRKGLEVALEALAQLQRAGHDVVLRCIGPFETKAYQGEILARIERLGVGRRVEQVGFTDDVPAALAKLDAMVLPSLFGEGLPMVVLEAMAAGLPVIATRVEGTPEAITHGVAGLLAEPRDPSSLAAEIAALVGGRHDWQRISQAARDRHRRCFSDSTMAEATASVYRSLHSRPCRA